MKISISSLARSFNLSDEALRFYERKGLLNPERTDESRYRKFERVDIQRVANIKRLQNQGFQLDEIRAVYSGIAQDEMMRLQAEKLEEMKFEIRFKQLVVEQTEENLRRICEGDQMLSAPRYCHSAPIYLMAYDSIETLWGQVNVNDAIKKLFCHLPLSSFTTVIAKAGLTELHDDHIRKGVLIGRESAELLGIDVDALRMIDASYAVSYLMPVSNGEFNLDVALPEIDAYMKANNLTAIDDLFTIQLMNFNLTQEQHIHYTDLIVPVRRSALDISPQSC